MRSPSRKRTGQMLAIALGSIFLLFPCALAFDPHNYSRKTVQCDTVRREPAHEQVKIELSYIDINDKSPDTILMVHGWPSIWSTWSKQIQAFEDEDYRLLVPDLRGFGYSSHPDDFKSSHTMGDIVHDLVCILEDAKVSSAVCMGHDWGSQVCHQAARMRPDIFRAVVGLVVPYIPAAGPYVSIKEFIPILPKLAYQTYFDRQTQAAAAELSHDIRRTLRATMRSISSPPPDDFLKSETSYLEGWKEIVEIPPVPFLSAKEEDYLVETFEKQGFLYTLGFYTEENRQLSHAFDHEQGNFTIPQPVLLVLPTKDPVADWKVAMKTLNSSTYLPNLVVKFIEGAHWVHLENADSVNKAIKEWLPTLPEHPVRHLGDEL